jgi:acyl-CoA reductase-like NAD-dependent aldehyde dehydrogenase
LIAAVGDAAERWTDADFPPRVRATRAVIARTGYTEPVVDYALDRLFESITRGTLAATIESELGSANALDEFVSRAGRPDVWYRGVERAVLVASDTTIGVAIPHLAFALCAKASVIVKDRSDELIARFAETLVEEGPEFARAIAVDVWNSDDRAANRAAFEGAQTVVAFGSDAALHAIRNELDPETHFVAFGHRTSMAMIARDAFVSNDERDLDALAEGLARDALLYDGEGCLSVHAALVEADAAVFADFAARVARACSAASIEFPPGSPTLDPRTAAYRASALFRASQTAGRTITGGAAAPFVLDAGMPLDEPPPLAPRTLGLYRLDDLADARAFVARHALPLEAVAVAPEPARERLDEVARTLGAARLCRIGTSQDPPLTGNHGGAGRILPFVRAMYRG